MPKRVTLVEHLSCDTLEQRYREASDPVKRSHYQILWLLAKGKRTEQVTEVTGYSLRWIRVIAHRYTQQGDAGVGDGRHHNPGADSLLRCNKPSFCKRLKPPSMKVGCGMDGRWLTG